MTKLALFDPSLFVGFDELLSRVQRMHEDFKPFTINYPPYNVRKIDENHYVIEMAVAGFAEQDIDIVMEGDRLTIKGEVKTETGEPADLGKLGEYIHRGIGMRSFSRSFMLSDHVEVENASLINGMLKVWLERQIPEEKKPKKIPVKTQSK